MQKIATRDGVNRRRISLFFAEMAFYWQNTGFDDPRKCERWERQLSDLDFDVAMSALDKLAQTTDYPPTIKQIRETYAEIALGDVPTANSVYAVICYALSTYGYYRYDECEREFLSKQDPRIQVFLLGLGWRNICSAQAVDLKKTVTDGWNEIRGKIKLDGVLSDSLKVKITACQTALIASCERGYTECAGGVSYD